MIVYKLTNQTTGRSYIGITAFTFEERLHQHKKASRRRKSELYSSARKHGWESFAVEILASATNVGELWALERALITAHGTLSPAGYNMTFGGEGRPGSTASAETRAKISALLKGRPKSKEHAARAGAARRGHKHSPESIARMSAAKRGRKNTPDAIAKTAASNRGRRQTAETIAKRIASRLAGAGYAHTAEARAKMSVAKAGRKMTDLEKAARAVWQTSPEYRAKVSASLCGRKQPPELVEKRRSAQLRAYALRRSGRDPDSGEEIVVDFAAPPRPPLKPGPNLSVAKEGRA